ncbi:hypothetical protein F0L74_30625 [Chitinophaga agrisoli]|uniref:Uncharacterized protein n=1 Tax=Chitinophaga agrisoli TaxID=2607653 RepID=A0A5B2VP92_9BACT|nr:hypothetical protein [Chitinophaga agrisoli]KAA2240510.1 hypothetical protein F0L74_30625 [Chitinophaga agrisoli]
MRRKPGLGVLKFILLGILFVTVLGFVVMTLWNCLIPDLFHGPVITFWQALGLLLLGKLLFGWHGHQHGAAWKANWKEKMRRRMESMTPEEKERLRDRCRFGSGKFFRDEEEQKQTQE